MKYTPCFKVILKEFNQSIPSFRKIYAYGRQQISGLLRIVAPIICEGFQKEEMAGSPYLEINIKFNECNPQHLIMRTAAPQLFLKTIFSNNN